MMTHYSTILSVIALHSLSPVLATTASTSYPQVATGQVSHYNENGEQINALKEGDRLYGQDAQYRKGAAMSYRDNGDGTVTDLNTGLMWQVAPPTEGYSWQQAQEYCEKLELGGHSDWRLPSAKELYSISDFSEGWPYLNSKYFKLVNNERVGKDEQYWTSNKYLGSIARGGHNGAFGVNHATGHIKTYSAGRSGAQGGQGGEGGPGGQRGSRPQGGGPQGDHVGAPSTSGSSQRMGPPQGGSSRGGRPQGRQPLDFATILKQYDKDGDSLLNQTEFAAALAGSRPANAQRPPRPQGAQGAQGAQGSQRPQGAGAQGSPRPQGQGGAGGPQGSRSPQGQGGAGGPQGSRSPQGRPAAPEIKNFDQDGDSKLNEKEFHTAMRAQMSRRPQGGPPGQNAGGMRRNPAAKQVRAVRGTPYGINKFVDNGDGTITDQATGLMWAKVDSQKGMDWASALAYAENATLAGHSDWRLPNVKELQGIVNYDRAPNSSDPSKEGPAIDPIFQCSDFVNAKGVKDYPYFWTSTSARFRKGSDFFYAWYVAFGRAVNGQGEDSHGAGAVRFDTKHKDGPAGEDAGRVYNYVRIVRDAK